jgi:hypothetical protein
MKVVRLSALPFARYFLVIIPAPFFGLLKIIILFRVMLAAYFPNPNPEVKFNFGLCSPREVDKFLRSPPYTLDVGRCYSGSSAETSPTWVTITLATLLPPNPQLPWSTQSSLPGLS